MPPALFSLLGTSQLCIGSGIRYGAKAVAEVIFRTRPDVIITHSCGAQWGDHVLIVMDAEQTLAVCRAATNSTVVATHMESLDHATVTREALRKYSEANGIGPEKLLIPLDGEKIPF
jgi:hypothetical protein